MPPERLPSAADLAREMIAIGYRGLAKQYHPDAGGSHEAMLQVTKARQLLEGHLGGDGGRARVPPEPEEQVISSYEPGYVVVTHVSCVFATRETVAHRT
jgi:hypothetical protein